MNLRDPREGFVAESRELLDHMEALLLSLGRDPTDSGERVHAMFHIARRLKAAAILPGLDYLVRFADVAERILDRIRDERLAVDTSSLWLLLACCDQIRAMVTQVATECIDVDPELSADAEVLLIQLFSLLAPSKIYGAGNRGT